MSEKTRAAYPKVIVGLCHGAADADTVRMAAEFAQLVGLDLHCLLIEDEALLALAKLPFAREFRLPSHKWSPLNAEIIEAEIRQTAVELRRLMDEIVRDLGVPSEFHVRRGDPATCIAAVCQTGDIVVVTETGASTVPATHSLTRLHAGAHESATSILFLPTRLKARKGAIVTILTDVGDAALDMASRLAITAKEALVILLPEPVGIDAARELEADAKNRAQAIGLSPVRINVRFVHDGEADETLQVLAGAQERLIVMPRAALTPSVASRIAAARGVPVLLVEAEARVAQDGPRESYTKTSRVTD